MKDLKKLSWTFWLLAVLCMFAVGLYVPFMDGANRLLVERFCFTPVTAGRALVVTYLTAVLSSPLIGILVDKVGYKRFFIIGCMGTFTIASLIFLVYPQCDEGGFT
jgi:nitrate/nitrite transporter NarK